MNNSTKNEVLPPLKTATTDNGDSASTGNVAMDVGEVKKANKQADSTNVSPAVTDDNRRLTRSRTRGGAPTPPTPIIQETKRRKRTNSAVRILFRSLDVAAILYTRPLLAT